MSTVISHVAAYEMAKSFVDAEIKNPVVVFSKTYCPFCKMAKGVLADVGVHYTLHELDERGRWSLRSSLPLGWVSGEQSLSRYG